MIDWHCYLKGDREWKRTANAHEYKTQPQPSKYSGMKWTQICTDETGREIVERCLACEADSGRRPWALTFS